MPPRTTRRPSFNSPESPPRSSGAHDPLFATSFAPLIGPNSESGSSSSSSSSNCVAPPPPPLRLGSPPPGPTPAMTASSSASASTSTLASDPSPITNAFLASPFASTHTDSEHDDQDLLDSTTDDLTLTSTEPSSTSLNRRHAVTIEASPGITHIVTSVVTAGTPNALPPPPPRAGGQSAIPPTPVQAQEQPPKANISTALPKPKVRSSGAVLLWRCVFQIADGSSFPLGKFPPSQQALYTFPSPPPDSSDIVSELQEFYSYVEVPQVIDHKDSFLAWWDRPQQSFIDIPASEQLEIIQTLLDGLASPDPDARFTVARHLLYIAQGSFESSTSPDHHLQLIQANCSLLRNAKALDAIWDTVKKTGEKWERVSHLPNSNPGSNERPSSSCAAGGDSHPHQEEAFYEAQHRQEQLDEINSELALLLAVLYFMMEVHRGDQGWAEELMQLDPPMPIYLFNLVAGLRERNAKGYPVKKLLLLLWKSILACIGGQSDIPRVRALVRSIEGLEPNPAPPRKPSRNTRPSPPSSSSSTLDKPSPSADSVLHEAKPQTKVAPTDFAAFNSEITSKYPSYVPPPLPIRLPIPIEMERIAAAAAPQPVRPIFSYHMNPNHDPSIPSNQPVSSVQGFQQGHGGMQSSRLATPAPTPPASPAPPPPKPKKQQYQTDQSKPFVLPFAPSNSGVLHHPPSTSTSTSTSSTTTTFGSRFVPRSIEEAGQLYANHLRVSTELWQSWKVREEFLNEETGIAQAERLAAKTGGPGGGVGKKALGGLNKRMQDLSLNEGNKDPRDDISAIEGSEEGGKEDVDPFSIKEKEGKKEPSSSDPLEMLRKMEGEVSRLAEEEKDQEKKLGLEDQSADLKRLMRVEMLYRAVLPQMQSAVIVLLKLLLATVTANNNQNQGGGNADSGNDEPIELSLEDTDIMRHREITSKAVSAILILALKWFKTSHVMKFHYLSQLLVDSNCLLLILKMFGLQEVSTSVKTKNDRADQNFFKFCHDLVNPPEPSDPLTFGGRPRSSSVDSSHSDSSSKGAGGAKKPPTDLVDRPSAATNKANPITTTASHLTNYNTKNHHNGATDDDQVEYITDYSWRNFFSVINFVHILQKLTKRKTHRVLLLVQYKSSAILKRILKVSHPTLQLYVLKVIKSQVPYCGRKWRQSNMKVITAIYLHCRPDLRDEWLTGIDVDHDVEESLPHEQALRALVRFFNTKHYGSYAPQLHRRSSVTSPGNDFAASRSGVEGGNVGGYGPGAGAGGLPSPGIGGSEMNNDLSRPLMGSSTNDDVFPPSRPITSFDFDTSDPSNPNTSGHPLLPPTSPTLSRYPSDYPSNLDEYADYEVDDLLLYPRPIDEDGYLSTSEGGVLDPLEASRADWERLGQLVGQYDEDISDSESVGSLRGLLGYDRAQEDEDGAGSDEGSEVSKFELEEDTMDERQRAAMAARNEWEHISPETITALEEERAAALPHSPRPSRRRSSTGPISPALRPVLIDRDDDSTLESSGGNAVDEGGDAGAGGMGGPGGHHGLGSPGPGPAPAAPHQGPAVDEVELVFGE
ncbi:BQ2448_1017 [Microbotryum intermedium]|uniref:BQ2448_1017 protein n=1 Tax=Microbotryum intermedium TaxID=269621 RepID=A0A238FCT0_9BASI|nr:BQ2448_1017 [Microbotryum intermedium]